jgi:hypothetical protein
MENRLTFGPPKGNLAEIDCIPMLFPDRKKGAKITVDKSMKPLTDFLVGLGIDEIPHSRKSYLGHLIAVYRLMETHGCNEELCRAGMFHSIYGTQLFQGFKLLLEQRPDVRALIGERAERLAYFNCFMNRETFDSILDQNAEPYVFLDRHTGEEIRMNRTDFDDLCRVHLYDWLEQVPRSAHGWDYRRSAYRRMAERLGGPAQECYERVFAGETRTPSSEPAEAGNLTH